MNTQYVYAWFERDPLVKTLTFAAAGCIVTMGAYRLADLIAWALS